MNYVERCLELMRNDRNYFGLSAVKFFQHLVLYLELFIEHGVFQGKGYLMAAYLKKLKIGFREAVVDAVQNLQGSQHALAP